MTPDVPLEDLYNGITTGPYSCEKLIGKITFTSQGNYSGIMTINNAGQITSWKYRLYYEEKSLFIEIAKPNEPKEIYHFTKIEFRGLGKEVTTLAFQKIPGMHYVLRRRVP